MVVVIFSVHALQVQLQDWQPLALWPNYARADEPVVIIFDVPDVATAKVVISDGIYAMLLTHEKFAEFTTRKIADAATVKALISLSVDSKGWLRCSQSRILSSVKSSKEVKRVSFCRRQVERRI
jgi:hypothetical protein